MPFMLNENQPVEDIELDENGAVITSTQKIGDDYFQDLEDAKEDFAFRFDGLTPVASIPEATVNKWIREGFDFWNATANEIVKKLKREDKGRMVISGNKTFDR